MINIPLKPEGALYTDSQWQAIYDGGDNLLVSASAGSGKTTVLAQRIVETLKRGVGIDELLVVTFTELAAKEMKERIEKKIKEEINTTVDDTLRRHLQEQILLLPQADISTIHAFCLKLIRQFFHLANIDPVFSLMSDEMQKELLKEQVWQTLKEQLYEEESFQQLAKVYASDKADTTVDELIFNLHTFSRASATPDQWLDNLEMLYDVNQLEESPLVQQVVYPLLETLSFEALRQLQIAQTFVSDEPALLKWHDILSEDCQQWQVVYTACQHKASFDNLRELIHHITFKTWSTSKAVDSDEALKEMKDKAKAYRESAKETLAKLKAYVTFSGDKQVEFAQHIRPLVKEMGRVTKLFAQAYDAEKVRRKVLEFSDLEHVALNILAPVVNGVRQNSEATTYYQQRFHEVLVDEYQDVNRLQEAILSRLSNGKNMFMVGDVKQSIYGFRLADPSLFLEKYEAFGKNLGGRRIILAENFRSKGAVLHGVNFIFQQIMDKAVGQMAYDELAMLKEGVPKPIDPKDDMEILLYESGKSVELADDGDEESIFDNKKIGEFTMVAQKIKQILANNPETNYSDIALLVSSRSHNLLIQEVFKQYDIPLVLNDSESYFQRIEVMIMLSVLKLIDNPYQDIPLASVLRSPLVKLDENELAAIRITNRKSDYYRALLSFMRAFEKGELVSNTFNNQLYRKLETFLANLTKWRQMAHREPLMTLIWTVYQDTQFLDYVLGLPAGKQRQANLYAFIEYAKSFEEAQFKGLFQFIRFVEKMAKKGRDLQEAPQTVGDNTVSLMTIHQSKGLEFKHVFVLNLSAKFNHQDLNGKYLTTEEYGVGTDYFDVSEKWHYKTTLMQAMKEFKRQKLLAEDMRKLYVALTRAKEKLYLVGSCQSQQHYFETLANIQDVTDMLLPVGKRLNAQSFLDWISMALLRNRQSENAFLPKMTYPLALAEHPVYYTMQFYTEEQLQHHAKNLVNSSKQPFGQWFIAQQKYGDKQENIADHLAALTQTYAYQVETQTTSYQSVSELKRLVEDPDTAKMGEYGGQRYVTDDLSDPEFLTERSQVTGAQMGTAVHILMQQLPLTETMTSRLISQTLQQLVAKQLITQDIAETIDVSTILTFFETPFGRLLQSQAQHVYREVPFSLVVKAHKLFSDMTDTSESILVHGMIDGYIDTPEGLIVYDFKTDKVKESKQLVARYQKQLDVYAQALEAILRKPVVKKYICALHLNEVITL